MIAWGSVSEHRLAHRAGVEQVERDRLRAERPHALAVSRRPERADRLVASIDQLGNQPGADRTARACNEDSHRELLLVGHIPRISGVYCYDPPQRRIRPMDEPGRAARVRPPRHVRRAVRRDRAYRADID
jgi:hypothetical protein